MSLYWLVMRQKIENCHTVKEKRGMKNSQRDDVEKDRSIEHVKRIWIDKIVKQSDKTYSQPQK